MTEEVKALLLNKAKEFKGSAPHVHGADGASPVPRWSAAGRTRVGVESRNHTQRNARSEVRDRLRRWLLVAWPQAQRRPFTHLTERYHRHCGWTESSRSAISHHAFVYAADGDGSAPPIDRPEGLHRRGITHSRDDCDQAQQAGLLPKKSGQKSTPKKLPETDAIFAQVKQRNEEADADKGVLRLSMDAKATVKVGPFARGGKSRVPTKAADHDFEPTATVAPLWILLPASDELFL